MGQSFLTTISKFFVLYVKEECKNKLFEVEDFCSKFQNRKSITLQEIRNFSVHLFLSLSVCQGKRVATIQYLLVSQIEFLRWSVEVCQVAIKISNCAVTRHQFVYFQRFVTVFLLLNYFVDSVYE